MSVELLKKLRYKTGPAIVLNAPEGFRLGVETDAKTEGTPDFVLLFVRNMQEAEEWVKQAIRLLKEDALFWIAFPKQSSKLKSDLNRDTLANAVVEGTAYRPVSNVAIDEVWSALRFREKEKVISKTKEG